MAWIRIINEKEATGKLKEIYTKVIEQRGKIGNILKVHSLDPAALEAQLDLYTSIMFSKSGLEREEREMLAVAVSVANGCNYGKFHHGEALNHYWQDENRLKQFMQGVDSFPLPEKSRVMVDYALKLTRTPAGVTEQDTIKLRSAGFSDESILNMNLIIGLFNLVNRVASGLGVEYSEEEIKGYKY